MSHQRKVFLSLLTVCVFSPLSVCSARVCALSLSLSTQSAAAHTHTYTHTHTRTHARALPTYAHTHKTKNNAAPDGPDGRASEPGRGPPGCAHARRGSRAPWGPAVTPV